VSEPERPAPVRLALRDHTVMEFDTPEQANQFALARPDMVIGLDTPELAEGRARHREASTPVAQAGLAGFEVGNELLLGLPEAAARSVSPEFDRGIDIMRDANPTTSDVARVGGAVAGGLAGGAVLRGASTGARVLRGAALPAAGISAAAETVGGAVTRGIAGEGAGLARQVLGRTAGLAAEGATEAGLYEGAHLMTEAALGDTRLSADQVISRMGRSVLFGGTLGGGVGTVIGAGQIGGRLARHGGEAIARTWESTMGTQMHPMVARVLGRQEAGQDIVAQLRRGGPEANRALEIIESGDAGIDDGARRLVDEGNRFIQDAGHIEDYARGSLRRDAVRRRIQSDPEGVIIQAHAAAAEFRAARELARRLQTDPLYMQGGLARGRELEAHLARAEAELAANMGRLGAVRRQGPPLLPARPAALAEAATNPGGRRAAVDPLADTVAPNTVALPGRALANVTPDAPPPAVAADIGDDWYVPPGAAMDRAMAAQAAGDLYVMVDTLKRQIGNMARRVDAADPEAAAVLRARYNEMIGPLENAGLWGQPLATMQRELNSHWHRYLNAAPEFNRHFTANGPVDPENAWRVMREMDPAKAAGFLRQHGLAKNDRRMRIFQEALEARAALHRAIGENMDLPPDLLGRAASAQQRIADMRKVLDDVGERAQVLNQWSEAQKAGYGAARMANALGAAAWGAGMLGAGGFAVPLGLAAVGARAVSQRANIARAIASARRMVEQSDTQIRSAVQAVVGTGKRVARASHRARFAGATAYRQAYQERVKRLEQEARPQAAIEALAEGTRGLEQAPRLRSQMQMAAVRGTMFLQARRPRGHSLPGQLRPSRDQLPPDADIQRFLRYARAVDEPGSIIDDMADGDLTRESAEVLRSVYPALHQHIVAQVMEELSAEGANPPYRNRVQLGILLGAPTDPSLAPAFLATIQGAHSQLGVSQFGQNGSRSQGQSATQPRPPNVGSAAASDTDRLTSRRSS
jgi:hypothetical protein